MPKKKNFKYRYHCVAKRFGAFDDINSYNYYNTSGDVVVREKIDLTEGLFSNNGSGAYTWIETPRGDTLYIERRFLRSLPLFVSGEKRFQKQVEDFKAATENSD